MPQHASNPVPAGSNELESDRTDRRRKERPTRRDRMLGPCRGSPRDSRALSAVAENLGKCCSVRQTSRSVGVDSHARRS
ncbi:hypothetical protein GW17_00031159 [Ensete ventricosum]|nr:hypothetical protein GW17_00031159 [Ensete ventricosum]